MTFLVYDNLEDIPRDLLDVGKNVSTDVDGRYVIDVIAKTRVEHFSKLSVQHIQRNMALQEDVRQLINAMHNIQNTIIMPKAAEGAEEWCRINCNHEYNILRNNPVDGCIIYFHEQRDAALFRMFHE